MELRASRFEPCCPPTSFIELADELCPGPQEDRRPFRRICELMRRAGASTMLVHKHVERESFFENDYPRVAAYLRATKRRGKSVTVSQVTFFSRAVSRRSKSIPRSIKNRNVLATVVLVSSHSQTKNKGPVRQRTFVFEGVVSRPALAVKPTLPNYYYHVFSTIIIHAGGRQFELKAAYFVQQDKLTTACAHVALQMALFHVDKTDANPEPTLSGGTINSIVRRSQHDRAVRRNRQPDRFQPSAGLSLNDIRVVLKKHGLSWYALNTQEYPEISAYDFAYLLVESGIPTLIAFAPLRRESRKTASSASAQSHLKLAERDLHVIHAIGHTTNYDEWLPMALATGKYESPNQRNRLYISSACWAPHLIVHDDSLGPYHSLGEGDLTFYSQDVAGAVHRALNPKRNSNAKDHGKVRLLGEAGTRIRYVLGIVPEADRSTTLTPYFAENLAFRALKYMWPDLLARVGSPWRARLEEISFDQLVLRTQLIKRQRYLTYISRAADHQKKRATSDRAEYKEFQSKMRSIPDRFWITEFSLPDLYSVNRSKLGEILIDFAPSKEALKTSNAESIEEICLAIRICGDVLFRDFAAVRLGFKSHTPLIRRRNMPALDY